MLRQFPQPRPRMDGTTTADSSHHTGSTPDYSPIPGHGYSKTRHSAPASHSAPWTESHQRLSARVNRHENRPGQFGATSMSVSLYPLYRCSWNAPEIKREGKMYTRTYRKNGEAIFSKCLGVLNRQHVQSCLADFVFRHRQRCESTGKSDGTHCGRAVS